jgi:hypothetical protein
MAVKTESDMDEVKPEIQVKSSPAEMATQEKTPSKKRKVGPKESNQKWTDAEDNVILSLRQAGHTVGYRPLPGRPFKDASDDVEKFMQWVSSPVVANGLWSSMRGH